MFKAGDKVVCIYLPEHPNSSLTVGKRYEVVRCGRLIDVVNDKGWLHSYSKYRFITIEQDRRNKLNIICLKLETK
jgi:hypothetical protein